MSSRESSRDSISSSPPWSSAYQAVSGLISPVLVLGLVAYWVDATWFKHQGQVLLAGILLGLCTGFYTTFKRLAGELNTSFASPAKPPQEAPTPLLEDDDDH